MTVVVYLPLAASLLLAIVSPWLSTRLRPAFGTVLLTVTTGLAAAGSTWALALLAGTMLDELSRHELSSAAEPVADLTAQASLLALVAGTGWLIMVMRRRRRLYRALRSACDRGGATDLDGDACELVVIADPQPLAFAVGPALPPRGISRIRRAAGGHIVVSEGMLRILDPAQRRVLLAHERAHLQGRHDWMLAAAEAAAAVNPILIPARRAVAYLCERWADEAAAAAVGDRHLTARALATAALANTPQGVGPAFNDLSVTRRVIALRRDPPPPRRLAATGIVLLCGAIVAADLHATHDFVELARRLIPS